MLHLEFRRHLGQVNGMVLFLRDGALKGNRPPGSSPSRVTAQKIVFGVLKVLHGRKHAKWPIGCLQVTAWIVVPLEQLLVHVVVGF